MILPYSIYPLPSALGFMINEIDLTGFYKGF